MACMFPLDENVHLCGVDTKIVTHSGRRSQLLLSAMRCGHPSSYIGSSVDRASVLSSVVSDSRGCSDVQAPQMSSYCNDWQHLCVSCELCSVLSVSFAYSLNIANQRNTLVNL